MIGEARITQAGPNGENAPAPHILHDRDLTQTLDDRIIVHQYQGLVWADLRDRLTQTDGKVETMTLPIAGEVLCAAVDGTARFDDAGAADSNVAKPSGARDCLLGASIDADAAGLRTANRGNGSRIEDFAKAMERFPLGKVDTIPGRTAMPSSLQYPLD